MRGLRSKPSPREYLNTIRAIKVVVRKGGYSWSSIAKCKIPA
jgi:hypothetical protein